MHIWTVVRVLQHTTPDMGKEKEEGQLNLSSDDSLSAASLSEDDLSNHDDTRATLEMPEIKVQHRDPVPEGFVRKPVSHEHSNPRLTLVFMAYERSGVADVTKNATLINVSHIAHKFSQNGV